MVVQFLMLAMGWHSKILIYQQIRNVLQSAKREPSWKENCLVEMNFDVLLSPSNVSF
jgi:hypothetical protein